MDEKEQVTTEHVVPSEEAQSSVDAVRLCDDPKVRVDALLRLQAAARDRFENRRRVEWRVNFGVWATMLLVANALSRDGLARTLPSPIAVGVGAILVVLGYAFWISLLARHGDNDRVEAWNYEREVEHLVGYDQLREPEENARKVKSSSAFKLDWGAVTGLVITAMLAAVCVGAVNMNSISTSTKDAGPAGTTQPGVQPSDKR